jgi:hypothetical protein
MRPGQLSMFSCTRVLLVRVRGICPRSGGSSHRKAQNHPPSQRRRASPCCSWKSLCSSGTVASRLISGVRRRVLRVKTPDLSDAGFAGQQTGLVDADAVERGDFLRAASIVDVAAQRLALGFLPHMRLRTETPNKSPQPTRANVTCRCGCHRSSWLSPACWAYEGQTSSCNDTKRSSIETPPMLHGVPFLRK